MNDVQIVILAAGKGSRLGLDTPKPLVTVGDKPMFLYVVESAKRAGIVHKPILIISGDTKDIQNIVGNNAVYAFQEIPNGTGGAVLSAKNNIDENVPYTIVLYSDMPYIRPETLSAMVTRIKETKAKIVLGLCSREGTSVFDSFGRIVRDTAGNIERIVEVRDANETEKALLEVNPSRFCFDTKWLLGNLDKLDAHNAQSEYYLTDLIGLAIAQGEAVSSFDLSHDEGLGVNTPEELVYMRKIFEGA